VLRDGTENVVKNAMGTTGKTKVHLKIAGLWFKLT
jgi:hypothetical protein